MNARASKKHREMASKKLFFIFLAFALVVVTFIIDLLTGSANLSVGEVLSALCSVGSGDQLNQVIVWVYRLPVALMALAVGAALAAAGLEMQTILDNPMASPYTLGISAAAGFGAALGMVLNVSILPFAGDFLVPANAFMFSLISCMVLWFISKFKQMSSETMLLTGIAMLFMFEAFIALLEYIATPEQAQAIIFWLFGNLNRADFGKVAILTAVLLVIIPLFARDAWKYTTLRMGEEKARSLGVDVEKLRITSFVLISILTATAVCFVGTIGFIGLVAPHIARFLVGEDQRFLLPLSLIIGALLLSCASIGSKIIMPGIIFPVGIIASMIGIPFFMYLVLKSRKGYW